MKRDWWNSEFRTLITLGESITAGGWSCKEMTLERRGWYGLSETVSVHRSSLIVHRSSLIAHRSSAAGHRTGPNHDPAGTRRRNRRY